MDNGTYLNTLNNEAKAREIYDKANFKSYADILEFLQTERVVVTEEDEVRRRVESLYIKEVAK